MVRAGSGWLGAVASRSVHLGGLTYGCAQEHSCAVTASTADETISWHYARAQVVRSVSQAKSDCYAEGSAYNLGVMADAFLSSSWRRATNCGPDGGNCVEVNISVADLVAVRDSKPFQSAVLVFHYDEWRCVLSAACAGQYDSKSVSPHSHCLAQAL